MLRQPAKQHVPCWINHGALTCGVSGMRSCASLASLGPFNCLISLGHVDLSRVPRVRIGQIGQKFSPARRPIAKMDGRGVRDDPKLAQI
jgi:hypothetical protein